MAKRWVFATVLTALGWTGGCDGDDSGGHAGHDVADTADVGEADVADETAGTPDVGEDVANGPDADEDVTNAPDVAAPTGREQASTSGAYTAWARDFDGPLTVGQVVTVPVTVRLASGAQAVGLDPAVSFIHIGMGHGGAKAPFVTEVGGGEYLVEDVQASMAGTWALKLTLAAGESVTWEVSTP